MQKSTQSHWSLIGNRTSNKDHIEFRSGIQCYSMTGRVGRIQDLALSPRCAQEYTLIQEVYFVIDQNTILTILLRFCVLLACYLSISDQSGMNLLTLTGQPFLEQELSRKGIFKKIFGRILFQNLKLKSEMFVT